jgi:hypothetical protein
MMQAKGQSGSLPDRIETLILNLRREKVILDADLASIYGVTTKRLNEQLKRNSKRFPEDFCFRLTRDEQKTAGALRSQNATLKKGRGEHRKYLSFAFTEHGAIMAANVLNSERAVEMSVFVVRDFIRMRSMLSNNKELVIKLISLKQELKKRLDIHETVIVGILQSGSQKPALNWIFFRKIFSGGPLTAPTGKIYLSLRSLDLSSLRYSATCGGVLHRIMTLIDPPQVPVPKKRRIGFGSKED